jgi:peptidoglycan hydrolase CwlO-like protein
MHKLKTLLRLFLVLVISAGLLGVTQKSWQLPDFITQVFADEVQDLQDQINELEKLKKLSEDATKPLEAEVSNLEKRIANARYSIEVAKREELELADQIKQKEADLTIQYQIFSRRVTQQYKRIRTYSPLVVILSSDSASELSKNLAYRESVKNQDNQFIKAIGEEIRSLQADKQRLADNQVLLASLEKQLDEQASFFKIEISKAKDYQKDLTGKIAELSARQQEIINARSGGFMVNLGSGSFGSFGKSSRSHFLNEAPGGYFAVFSFGGYSHRNGMSQFGALGRVNQGQNAEQVLKYYYQGVNLERVDTNQNIVVNGTNSYGQTINNESYLLEDYLKHIYEVPGSWPKEVLKAQAIAARTFAYGKSTICPNQYCQEFKIEENTEAWKEAVKETEGIIMTGGSGTGQYASTHGGWINGVGWDTTDGSGGGNFLEKSYEVIAESPWAYSAWYVNVFGEWGKPKGDTCGRSNPWLSPEEMADIVNAHLVLKNGSSSETERISSISTQCWGGNPYSIGELKDLAGKYGGISSANSVSVSLGEGRTNTITINNEVTINGDDFCRAFNLRAPGYLRIPQWSGNQCSGAFFNVEKK